MTITDALAHQQKTVEQIAHEEGFAEGWKAAMQEARRTRRRFLRRNTYWGITAGPKRRYLQDRYKLLFNHQHTPE